MQSIKFANEVHNQDYPMVSYTQQSQKQHRMQLNSNSKQDLTDFNQQTPNYYVPKDYVFNQFQNYGATSATSKDSTSQNAQSKSRRILSEQQSINKQGIQNSKQSMGNSAILQEIKNNNQKQDKTHKQSQQITQQSIKPQKSNAKNAPFKAMVENVLQSLQQKSKYNMAKKQCNTSHQLRRREQSVSCLSQYEMSHCAQTPMPSHHRQQSKDNIFSGGLKFDVIQEYVRDELQNTRQEMQVKSQQKNQSSNDVIDKDLMKRSNTPCISTNKKKANNIEIHKHIQQNQDKDSNYGVPSKKQGVNCSIQQEYFKTNLQHTQHNHKLSKTPKASGSSKFSKSQNISSLQQSKNQKKPVQAITNIQIQEQPFKKIEKTNLEKKQFIKESLGSIIQGYKIRRILKHNKVVNMLRIEYKDLLKFANSLKQELTDNLKNGSSNTGQTRQLLIQSIKDLSQKKEQFRCAFFDALSNPNWLKQSKQYINVNPLFIDTKRLSNKNSSLNSINFEKNINSQRTQFKSEQRTYLQQINELLNANNTSTINEKEYSQGRNQKFKHNTKSEIQQQRDSVIATSHNQSIMTQVLKKDDSNTKFQNLNELKRYLTPIQNEIENTNPFSDDNLTRKEFLKKGIQSRKYDPRQSIQQEKERKKQKEKQISIIQEPIIQAPVQKSTFSCDNRQPVDIQPKRKVIQKDNNIFDATPPTPSVLKTEPSQPESISNYQQQQQYRMSQQFSSKIPRLTKNPQISQSQSSLSHCQSTKHMQSQSFLAPIIDNYAQETSPTKTNSRTVSRIPHIRRNSKTIYNQVNTSMNVHNKSSQELNQQMDQSLNKMRTARSRENRNSVTNSINLQDQKSTPNLRLRQVNNSCNFGDSNQQMQYLIQELQGADINSDAKKKTIDTLNAITGMLDSLRNNKLFDENKKQQNNKLKSTFDVSYLTINVYRVWQGICRMNSVYCWKKERKICELKYQV